ncbi:MAG: universal stress protein [Nocardioidaceae bacterium]
MSTQVNPANKTSAVAGAPVVIVGVDGSAHNRAAVTWARNEAEDLGGRLVLVGATPDHVIPVRGYSLDFPIDFFENETRDTLEHVREELGADEDDVSMLIGSGGARPVLLRAAKEADVLVVGKRGLGAAKRMVVGSNSISVAGRSPVAVVIVPDAWSPADRKAAPIVVGLDGSDLDEAVLTYGFERAVRLAVPLLAIHAWHLPATYAWSPDDIARWESEAKEQLDSSLTAAREKYPEVEVITLSQDANAAMAILDAAAVAQLVVLGRHTGPHHLGGFHLGSTTRAVLHYAECPVAVIPSSSRHPLADVEDLEADQPEF